VPNQRGPRDRENCCTVCGLVTSVSCCTAPTQHWQQCLVVTVHHSIVLLAAKFRFTSFAVSAGDMLPEMILSCQHSNKSLQTKTFVVCLKLLCITATSLHLWR